MTYTNVNRNWIKPNIFYKTVPLYPHILPYIIFSYAQTIITGLVMIVGQRLAPMWELTLIRTWRGFVHHWCIYYILYIIYTALRKTLKIVTITTEIGFGAPCFQLPKPKQIPLKCFPKAYWMIIWGYIIYKGNV